MSAAKTPAVTPATAKPIKEQPSMATEKKPTVADINAEIARLQAQRDEMRASEITDAVEGFIAKLNDVGLSLQEGIDRLKEKLPPSAATAPKTTRAPRASNGEAKAPKSKKAFVRGTTYHNPAEPDKDWVAGGVGAKPGWLGKLVKGKSFEEAKAIYEKYAKT
ncbi:H-NS family nucleoid-associated regulatory protein [Leptothrix discophora]|uniref:H-NS family nucleoid-associated regulatory protein n=1 Tax=Leptothrix discophora TaxID=89 RepID=A0ABT9G0A2_LEPDI|nr:H-NS family nucleoid-associated regulatory protein [Leptothrix discophora]MDP4299915.1 H-NS family nucleoid-associated regulatory protein [Leptothrix discophora]